MTTVLIVRTIVFHVPVGYGSVPAMLASDAEIKSQSSLLNDGRPAPPAPVSLPQQLRFQQQLQQQQLQQQLQQRGVGLSLWFLCTFV